MAVAALAALWGFAEATVFFVVPDVLLTAAPLLGRRAAVAAVAAALAGAVAGGAVMHGAGASDAAQARQTLDAVPGVSPPMIEAVARQLERGGLPAMALGAVTGKPYKIYAVEAGAQGVGLWTFLGASIPARLLRFAAVTAVAAWLMRGPLRGWRVRRVLALHAAVWAAVYAVYVFIVLP